MEIDPETGYGDDFYHAKSIPKDNNKKFWGVAYAATEPVEHKDDRGFPWRPAIHMPRWASRINLEITGVRVERLHDISAEDAIAEGIGYGYDDEGYAYPGQVGDSSTPELAFRHLWNSIHGEAAWDLNPWLWVISFKRGAGNPGDQGGTDGN